MQDLSTGQMKPLNQKMTEEEGEQAAKDEAQPEREQQGGVIHEGMEVNIGDENNPALVKGQIKAIGRRDIVIETLPGEAKRAGIKGKKKRVKK